MNLTQTLKSWLTENLKVPATASDDEYKKAASLAVFEDKLTTAKLAELTDEGGPDAADVIGQAIAKAMAPIAAKIGEIEQRQAQLQNTGALSGALESALADAGKMQTEPEKSTSSRAAALFASADPQIRVKSPIERYSSVKGIRTWPTKDKHGFPHPNAGMPVTMPNAFAGPLESLSQADTAIVGAYMKWASTRGGQDCKHPLLRMTEHDHQLMEYALHEMPWTGYARGPGGSEMELPSIKLNEFQRKALLDDSTSGGTEAAPVVVDMALITTPLLYGELFPLVEVVPIPRGRRIEGAAITNLTWTSGTAEGTAITPFTTTSMISAFDNTVYPAVAAIEIGNDFQEDSPYNIGQVIIEKAGEKAMEWLDNQIANGDGTTEPQGLFTASGTTDAGSPAGGASAAAQITDYENMYFGIEKAFRPPSDRARTVFIADDTSYKRARAIKVGSSDARRIFGLDEQSYTLMGIPYKVQNDIGNTKACCANLRYYRMYRRLGVTVRTETGGRTLALANETLLVLRMRWAGKLTLGGAMCYIDDMEA